MTGEQAKKILIDLCFRHPGIIDEAFQKLDPVEACCFIYEALADDRDMQVAAHEGAMDNLCDESCYYTPE